MPAFKRKRFSRRPLKRTKRVSSYKKRRYSRVPRSSYAGRVYKFNRWASFLNGYNTNTTHQWDSGNMIMYANVAPGSAEWDAALSFRFSDLKNTSEFSNLFDRYLIVGARVQFQLITNPDANNQLANQTTVNSANWYPKIWYTIDHDDSGIITRSQIQEYTNSKCRVLRPNQIVKAYVPFPRTAGGAGSGTTVYPSIVNGPKFVDMANRDIDHYGLKWAVDFFNLNTSTTVCPFAVKIDVKYYFKCKDPR